VIFLTDGHDRLAAVAARVQELEDREAIRDLIACYGFTADLNCFEEYVDQWAPDGEYFLGESILGHASYRGRDELMGFISDPRGAHRSHVSGRGSQHTSVNILVRVDGDTAWAESYSIVFVREAPDVESFQIYAAAYNHWELRRMDGRWRIQSRRRAPLRAEGVEARKVLTGFMKA
jgi:hypothetical protein